MMRATTLLVAIAALSCGPEPAPTQVKDDDEAAVTALPAAMMPNVSPSCDDGLPSDPTNPVDRIAALRCYECNHACSENRPSYCNASGWPNLDASCLKREGVADAYRWYEAGSDRPDVHQEYLRPFMLLPFIRKLRDAGTEDLNHVERLDRQLEVVLAHTKTYPKDELGPRAIVWQSKFVRSRDGATRYFADGLNQAAYAYFYLELAKTFRNQVDRRVKYLELALAFDNAMERPAGTKTGGIALKSQVACGAEGLKGDCIYYHSSAPHNQFTPGTALNQSLFVLRAATDMLLSISRNIWDNRWPSTSGLDRTAWMDRLRRRLETGMTQMAYSVGNSTTNPNEPPNLKQHMRRAGTTTPYFWATYQYDMANHVGQDAVTHDHVCSYHGVTLNNLASLLRNTDPDADGQRTQGSAYGLLGSAGPRVEQARKQLLSYTRRGIPETVGASDGNAVYQWFVAETNHDIREGQEGCPEDFGGIYDDTRAYLCREFGAPENAALVGCN